MNASTPTIERIQAPAGHAQVLAEQMDDWSREARDAHRSLLGALDAWSRQTGTSHRLNSWIAEEAVRRAW